MTITATVSYAIHSETMVCKLNEYMCLASKDQVCCLRIGTVHQIFYTCIKI